MKESHRVALPDKRHFSLPGKPEVGEIVTTDGRAFRIEGPGLREFINRVAYVTWPAQYVDRIDPNLTRARD